MPNYTYQCTACQSGWDQQRLIADRHQPASEPCPVCAETGTVSLAPSAPHIGDAYRQGVTKLPDTWTDNLKRIKKSHLRSTINV